MKELLVKSVEEHDHQDGLNLGAILMGLVCIVGSYFAFKQIGNPSETGEIAIITELLFHGFLLVLFLLGGILLIAYPIWDFYFSKEEEGYFLKISDEGLEIPSEKIHWYWTDNLIKITFEENDSFGWRMSVYRDGKLESFEFEEQLDIALGELEEKVNLYLGNGAN